MDGVDLVKFITFPRCSSVILPKVERMIFYLLKGWILKFLG